MELVTLQGNNIGDVPESPPVLSENAQGMTKTSATKDILVAVGYMEDVIKA